MAVSPVNISRVSNNLRTNFVLFSLQRSQREALLTQARIASGRSFLSPSENPIASSRALDLTHTLGQQEQFMANLQYGDNLLSTADSALNEINDLLVEATSIASQNVSNLTSADERASVAEVVARLRDQMAFVANTQFSGRYIFGGRETTQRPFISALGGIAYVGDNRALVTRAGEGLLSAVSVAGSELFGALSSPVATTVDLSPKLREETRLDIVGGAGGGSISSGTLVFNEPDGVGTFTVNLADADTIGDVIDLINASAEEAGSTVTASLGDDGLLINAGSTSLTITDRLFGSIAASLGILTKEASTGEIVGGALSPRVTRTTLVEDLAGGAALDLEAGFILTNGGVSTTIDISDALTVQDILNTINNAGVFVLARINESGTGIDVFNQVSGTSLSIGENGGTTAGDLGIRTFQGATLLSSVNFGRGVTVLDGQADLQVVARDGSTVDVTLDGAQTIDDVIDLINTAAEDAGVSIEASLAAVGNGISISDTSSGTGNLSVHGLNLSTAALDLGLEQVVTDPDASLNGEDIALTRTDGMLSALVDLERALRADDTSGITSAGERIDKLRSETTRIHGIVGARSQAMRRKQTQMASAVTTTRIFLSEIQDLDFTEAITKLQASLTQVQANLQTSSTLLNQSLLSFLR